MWIFGGITIILVILKVTHQIDCSWWLVFAPSIIEILMIGFVIEVLRRLVKLFIRSC